jgi:hypothetical protein
MIEGTLMVRAEMRTALTRRDEDDRIAGLATRTDLFFDRAGISPNMRTAVMTTGRSPVQSLGPSLVAIDDQWIGYHDAEIRRLESADLIIRRGSGSARCPATWMAGVFGRFPGCAVAAATDVAGQHIVGLRAGPVGFFRRWPTRGIEEPTEQTREITACAVFAHAWLAAGRPLIALDGRRIAVHWCDDWRRAGFTVTIHPRNRNRGRSQPGNAWNR